MKALLAKKIVQKVQSGLVSPLSYPRPQVEDAFRVMGVPLTAELLQPWTDQAKKVQEDPVALAARQDANRLNRERTLALVESRRAERAERRKTATARTAYLAALQQGVIAEHVQNAPVSAVDIAVAAGRAAFQQTMQKGQVPSSIEIQPIPDPPDPYLDDRVHMTSDGNVVIESAKGLDDLTADQLREMAKAKGLKGISTKKKADLIAMLTEA